ncbi:hypothetical protein BU25DRAFT_226585 [Macroventuria anomochaeta]|uniref:Uncharacterized protein n=1 Tax=Macroventuria anomochaeta TaxID=301207 RepID=A0ACB6SAB2_9PLEO|nr:uncharacterized protein BU25DRAFT_226585 [Macroventuria anomochaeta]KAF2631236.1 hypothetical protein BU25DRAFT_226585 [Macroventuria anomochaeta]
MRYGTSSSILLHIHAICGLPFAGLQTLQITGRYKNITLAGMWIVFSLPHHKNLVMGNMGIRYSNYDDTEDLPRWSLAPSSGLRELYIRKLFLGKSSADSHAQRMDRCICNVCPSLHSLHITTTTGGHSRELLDTCHGYFGAIA